MVTTAVDKRSWQPLKGPYALEGSGIRPRAHPCVTPCCVGSRFVDDAGFAFVIPARKRPRAVILFPHLAQRHHQTIGANVEAARAGGAPIGQALLVVQVCLVVLLLAQGGADPYGDAFDRRGNQVECACLLQDLRGRGKSEVRGEQRHSVAHLGSGFAAIEPRGSLRFTVVGIWFHRQKTSCFCPPLNSI